MILTGRQTETESFKTGWGTRELLCFFSHQKWCQTDIDDLKDARRFSLPFLAIFVCCQIKFSAPQFALSLQRKREGKRRKKNYLKGEGKHRKIHTQYLKCVYVFRSSWCSSMSECLFVHWGYLCGKRKKRKQQIKCVCSRSRSSTVALVTLCDWTFHSLTIVHYKRCANKPTTSCSGSHFYWPHLVYCELLQIHTAARVSSTKIRSFFEFKAFLFYSNWFNTKFLTKFTLTLFYIIEPLETLLCIFICLEAKLCLFSVKRR